MYTQADYDSLTRLLRRFYRNMALFCLVPTLLVVLACVTRVAVMGYAGAIALGLVFCVGWYGVGLRVFSYRRLVHDILNQAQRGGEGLVTAIERDHISRQGTLFSTIRLQVQDAGRGKPYERTVFYDSLKGEIPFREGQYVMLTLYDNVVKAVDQVWDPDSAPGDAQGARP